MIKKTKQLVCPSLISLFKKIKLKTFLLLTVVLTTVFGNKKLNAQVEVDTTFQTAINQIFENVDKTKVPYGILKDYAMEFIELSHFNGTSVLTDSTATNIGYFYDVYYTLFTGRINNSATGFVHPDTLNNQWYALRDTGKIVLSGLLFKYSKFKDNAAGNYITISGNQLYDKYVGGIWQDPYTTDLAFMVSPPVNKYSQQNLQVVLPSGLWFTNTSYSSFEVDFADGLGYRSIAFNTPISLSYATNGYKNWKFKLIMPDGVKYVHTNFLIGTDPGSL